MVDRDGSGDQARAIVETGHAYFESLREIGDRVVYVANGGQPLFARTYGPTISLPDLAREGGLLSGDQGSDNGEDN